MAEYKEETLKKLQSFELEIYKEFARVCEKHGLTFFVSYGTALGAIRHKGFIPWDDDMDVGMPREDYEKFIRLAPAELQPPFELLELQKTDGYVMTFAKVTNSNTTFTELTDQNRTYKSGIFIDIFPFDEITINEKKRRRLINKNWLLARLCVLSAYKTPKLPEGINPIFAFVSKLVCGIVYYGMKLFRISKDRLYSKYMKNILSANGSDNTEYVEFVFGAKRGIFYSKEELFPTVLVDFEDTKVPVPNDHDSYLTKIYGDYMELPPADKRHTHYPAVLKFDE